jgi:hypothetical protein
MLIAKWQIDARFGQKKMVIDKLKTWARDIAPRVGLTRGRLLTGSIGALEATVIHEWEVEDLAMLDKAWTGLADIAEHAKWSVDLEPFVVSGTARWEILRVL